MLLLGRKLLGSHEVAGVLVASPCARERIAPHNEHEGV